MDYRKKLWESKIAVSSGTAVSTRKLRKLLREFCDGSDLVSVPVNVAYSLFMDFCGERQEGPFSRVAVGRAVSAEFGLKSKSAYGEGEYYRVYVPAENV